MLQRDEPLTITPTGNGFLLSRSARYRENEEDLARNGQLAFHTKNAMMDYLREHFAVEKPAAELLPPLDEPKKAE